MLTKTKSKYVILGDSQVSAFIEGVENEGRSDLLSGASLGSGALFRSPFFSINQGHLELDREKTLAGLWHDRVGVEKLEELEGKLIVSMGLSSFQFYNHNVWRTFGEGRRFISDALIDTMITDQQKHVLEFYRHLVERGLIRAALMGPPPEETVNPLKIMSKTRLFELAQRYRQPVVDFLESAGITIIDLPLANSDGFLKAEYRNPSQGHASDFGPLAVAALEEL